MTTYTLKLVSGVNYNLYNGATLVSDSDLATLFGSAGSAFFVFDFNSGTPTNTTSLTIVNSNSQAVITTTGLSGIAENTNFNGDWSASATAFDTFVKSPAAVLDEAQMSDLMGKIKGSGGIPTNATFWGASYDAVNNKVTGDLSYTKNNSTIKIVDTASSYPYFGSSHGAVLGNPNYTMVDVSESNGSGRLKLWSQNSSILVRGSSFDFYAQTKITNVKNPTNAQDAATKNYVDTNVGDLTTLTTTAKTSAVAAINEVNAKVLTTYSTTEQVVGTWINGKPLYEKILDLGALPNNTSKQENIAGGAKVMTISVEAYMYPDANSPWSAYARAIPYQSLTNSDAIGLYYSEYVVGVTTNYDATAFNAYVKVRYWKTTD